MQQGLSYCRKMLAILATHQLRGTDQLRVIDVKTHSNAILAMLHGDAEAAVVPVLLWSKQKDRAGQHLQLLQTTAALPGVMLMAHPRLPAADVQALRAALADFNASAHSREYFFPDGFTLIDDATMNSIDAYTRIWQQTLR